MRLSSTKIRANELLALCLFGALILDKSHSA